MTIIIKIINLKFLFRRHFFLSDFNGYSFPYVHKVIYGIIYLFRSPPLFSSQQSGVSTRLIFCQLKIRFRLLI